MVLTSTEQEAPDKIDLSAFATSVYGATFVARTRETEHTDISLGEEYERLRPQIPEQPLHGESTSVHEITSPQGQESIGSGVSEVRIPPLEWSVRAHPVLTNQVRTLLRTLWAIVVSRSTQLRFPLSKTVVSVFTDPTEGESKAILRLSCHASISQALAFWDSLETDLQGWLNNLAEYERVVFITKISLRVYWL
jgi:hypothetical protein